MTSGGNSEECHFDQLKPESETEASSGTGSGTYIAVTQNIGQKDRKITFGFQ